MLFNGNGESVSESIEMGFTAEEMGNIMEQSILESCTAEEIQEFLEDSAAVNEAIRQEIVTERNIVRLDKKTKLGRAQKMAEFEIAKKKGDRDFRKLLTVWRMERELEAKIHKKYGNQAKSLGKKNFMASQQKKRGGSASSVINKATKNAKKQFNPEIKSKATTKPVKPLPVQVQMTKLK